MKGYLTVFLAMTLSLLTGFILMLTGFAIRNGEKVRLECAVDIGMNSVLSEFHIALFERYGLLYVDASYLNKMPSISNVEERLRFYVEENTSQILSGKNAPWGKLTEVKASISTFETAAEERGASMRNQAICYMQDIGISGPEGEVFSQMDEIRFLENCNPLGEWGNIMDELSEMEPPKILNEQGKLEEVSLSNPADWAYGLSQSDIFYLGETDLQSVSPIHIFLNDYISHRQIKNKSTGSRKYERDEKLFLSYLFEKLGYMGNPRENSLLKCQLEYLVGGNDSDLENVKVVAEKLFRWRFADNVSCALTDGDLRAQAAAAAQNLQAVQLKEAFQEPVIESILYACAFLESIADLKVIYGGGTIPVRKTGHQMSVAHLLDGSLYTVSGSQGFTYEQYLAAMILLMEESEVNLRAMDIMEMDLRFQDGNKNFAMDWCVERYEAEICAKGSYGSNYCIKRKYGYF